jgi:hypothetical protein
MSRLIDIEAKDKNDTTPDPLMAMIFFFIATSIYCVISIFISDSQRLIAKICYICFVIIGEYFINLTLTQQMCGVAQWKTTMFVTLIPWVLIFGVMHLFLILFPGWSAPFSNTFGYLVAKLMGLPDVMKEILMNPDERAENQGKAPQAEAIRALESIRSDNSLFINELYTEKPIPAMQLVDDKKNPMWMDKEQTIPRIATPADIAAGKNVTNALDAAEKPIFQRPNFEKAWKKLEAGQIVKTFPTAENLRTIMMDKLYHFVQMKYTIAEYVWNLLTGFLVTSISYNYILNTGCAKSPKEMKDRYDKYNAEEDKKARDKKKQGENQTVYVQA